MKIFYALVLTFFVGLNHFAVGMLAEVKHIGQKKAIIIGASSGIGEALAKALSKNGYIVGVTGRRIDRLNALSKILVTTCYVKQMDLRNIDESRKSLEVLIEEMGGIDLIIINAGVAHKDTDLDWEKQSEMIDVNVRGFTAMATIALKYFMQQKQGHIVGISSILALRAGNNGFTYSATKAYETRFLEGIRNTIKVQQLPITVTDIQPGFVDTAMTKDVKGKIWEVSPDVAADQIYEAIKRKREHAYITSRWRLAAWFMKCAPDWLFNRIPIK